MWMGAEMHRRLTGAASLAVAVACTTSHGPAVAITATDDSCDLAGTTFVAGTVHFAVTNSGRSSTDVAVLDGTHVLGQITGVRAGKRQMLSVRLATGVYEVSCMPSGAKGSIRAVFTVLAP